MPEEDLAKPPELPEDIVTIEQFKVKYNDMFHLKNLYNMLHEYLAEEGWYGKGYNKTEPPYDAHNDIETMYLEKSAQKGLHRGGKEMWVWWRLWKNYQGKYTKYFRFRLELDMHMVYMQDMEVMHKGKKLKVQKGEIEFFIRPFIESEMHIQWGKHWALRHLVDMFEKRIWSQELEKMEKELWREAYRFQGVIKRYLGLRTFIPTPEPFHPERFGLEP